MKNRVVTGQLFCFHETLRRAELGVIVIVVSHRFQAVDRRTLGECKIAEALTTELSCAPRIIFFSKNYDFITTLVVALLLHNGIHQGGHVRITKSQP